MQKYCYLIEQDELAHRINCIVSLAEKNINQTTKEYK